MEILQIAALGFIVTIIISLLKSHRPEITILLSLLFGIFVIFAIIGKLKGVMDLVNIYMRRADINFVYIKPLIKIIGITYITEFASEGCKDAKQNAIASKIELAGKVLILVIAVPIVTSVLELILSML